MTFRADFEHRDDLLVAAVNEFSTNGYDAASLNRILTASGVSKGQLYYHFANKEGLYLALVEWMIDEKLAWLSEHRPEPTNDFFANLEMQIRANVRFAAGHPDVDRMSRAVLRERGKRIFTEVTHRFAYDLDSAVAEQVAHAQANGQLAADVAPVFAQQIVLLVINHIPELFDLGEPDQLERQADQLITFLRRGLAG